MAINSIAFRGHFKRGKSGDLIITSFGAERVLVSISKQGKTVASIVVDKTEFSEWMQEHRAS